MLDMLFQLDISLLELLFVYTFKMSKKERFILSVHIPPLQLVTGLPDSCKGWAKGHVLVSGPWSGLFEGPNEAFSPQLLLEIPSRICFYHFLYILQFFFLAINSLMIYQFVYYRQEEANIPCRVGGKGFFHPVQQAVLNRCD